MVTASEKKLIRAGLEELLSWDELSRSSQLAGILRYVVEATLEGNQGNIKAYAIAVDVLNRPASFDPQLDPIVRVQGGRLRVLLDRFYHEKRNRIPVRIKIPTGRYVPEFGFLTESAHTVIDFPQPVETSPIKQLGVAVESDDEEQNLLPSETINSTLRNWYLAIAAIVLVGISIGAVAFLYWGHLREAPISAVHEVLPPPTINMGQFVNLTGDPGLDTQIDGLSLQLLADLSRFENLVIHQHMPNQTHFDNLENAPVEYDLSGVVRRGNYGVEFNVLLSNAQDGEVVWSITLSEPSVNNDYLFQISRVSQSVSAVLGSYRGPVHRAARAALVNFEGEEIEPTQYGCRVLGSLARDEQDPRLVAAADKCFKQLLADDPRDAIALAGWAGVEAQVLFNAALPGDTLSNDMFDVTSAARLARDLKPDSSFVRAQLAQVLLLQGEREAARKEYVAAVQRNPSNADVRADLALMLAFGGEWLVGRAQMELALESSPAPPPWQYTLNAVGALLDRNFDAAIANALVLVRTDPELGSVIALAAGPLAARADIVQRYSPIVRANKDFQLYGILPRLSQRIHDEEVLQAINLGLLLAGIPADFIASPTIDSGT